MTTHSNSTIRKFVRINHFSHFVSQVNFTAACIWQDDVAVLIQHLVIEETILSRVIVVLILFYCLKLLQELVLIISWHSVLVSFSIVLFATKYYFFIIRIVELWQLPHVIIIHHLAVAKVVVIFVFIALSLVL